MFGNTRRLHEIDLAERARISRMIRTSEAGWLFYGPGGDAFHVGEDEAARYERAALRLLARHLAYIRRLPLQMLGTAVLLGLVLAVSSAIMPRGFLQQTRWLVGPLGFAVILAQACGGMLYDLRLRRWQRGLAAQLAAAGRGGVAQPIAARHRRYNLFKAGGQVLALLFLLRAAVGLWQHGDAFRPGLIDVALIIFACAAHFAGLRIDTTHRRRKWLD